MLTMLRKMPPELLRRASLCCSPSIDITSYLLNINTTTADGNFIDHISNTFSVSRDMFLGTRDMLFCFVFLSTRTNRSWKVFKKLKTQHYFCSWKTLFFNCATRYAYKAPPALAPLLSALNYFRRFDEYIL